MSQKSQKKSQKVPKNEQKTSKFCEKKNTKNKFYCENCDYISSKKTNYNRHLISRKHLEKRVPKSPKKSQKVPKRAKNEHFFWPKNYMCEFCAEHFASRSSYYRHKNLCVIFFKKRAQNELKTSKNEQKTSKNEQIIKNLQNENTKKNDFCDFGENVFNNSEKKDFNNLEKSELRHLKKMNTILINQNTVLINQKQHLEKKNGDTINNSNNMTNSQNTNNISINMYLNEYCKNAMNLTDFVEKIKLELGDIKMESNYVDCVSNILIKNLKNLDVTERPIHCSDKKRLQFYIKEGETWEKDLCQLDESIENIHNKQYVLLHAFDEKNPNLDDETYFNRQKIASIVHEPSLSDKNTINDAIKRKMCESIDVKRDMENMD